MMVRRYILLTHINVCFIGVWEIYEEMAWQMVKLVELSTVVGMGYCDCLGTWSKYSQ